VEGGASPRRLRGLPGASLRTFDAIHYLLGTTAESEAGCTSERRPSRAVIRPTHTSS
jgi:hypothetical protein